MSKLILDYSSYYEDIFEYDRKSNPVNNVDLLPYKYPDDKAKFFSKRGFCPFCKVNIPIVYENIRSTTIGVDLVSSVKVWECHECGWWECFDRFSEEEDWIYKVASKHWDTLRHGIVKEFGVSDKNIPISTLITELKNKKDILYSINPYKLEEICQKVFSEYYSCEVKHVGKTGDGGIDLLVINSEEPILVQVKRREDPNYIELVSPIREFVGAMFLQNAKKGIFLSTAKDFSKGSKKIKETIITERKFEFFELINFDNFINMLGVVKSEDYKPWMKVLKSLGF